MTPETRSRSEKAWNSTSSTRIVSVTRTFSPRSGRSLSVFTSSRRYVEAQTRSPGWRRLWRCHRSSGFSTRTLISPVFGSRWRTRSRVWRWGPFLLAVSCEGQRSRWANLAGISLSLLSRGRIEPEVRISCIYTKEDLHGPENHHGPGAQGEAKVARVRLHRHMGRGQQGSPDHGTRLSIRLRRHDSGQWENLPIPGFRREGRRPISRPICLVRRQTLVAEIDGFLSHAGIDHEKTPATIGRTFVHLHENGNLRSVREPNRSVS